MKIIAAYHSASSRADTGMNIMVWPDSAWIRSGKPVFLPDDRALFVWVGLAAQISAVGKSIRMNFAHRYYRYATPVAFILGDAPVSALKAHGDPRACDIVTDCSALCGAFLQVEALGNPLRLSIGLSPLAASIYPREENSSSEEIKCEMETKEEINLADPLECLAKAIATASMDNTLKTGDLVGFMLPNFYKAEPDTLLKIDVDGLPLLENKLK